MRVAIGSDHGGFELKEKIKNYLLEQKITVVDYGTNSSESVDYPEYGEKVGHAVMNDHFDFGIVLCGTGIGISIAANKVEGIRAALIYDNETARLAKEHNNANVIAIGGRTTSYEKAISMINTFMKTSFEERHQRRLDKIKNIEGTNKK
ncbi:MAG: ribose 5-phosphate isomerase B [Tenericutes bacterium GWC2_34_14]|nr:MAG: ribose 5-phosphate isomerase B [Tenericutes bacterium GWA2_35_7]OHE29136.1 MAG: ribose 5-phosphate isomerase B [Tenericutes bacterium GWC2_34_14]OHE34096.1 MAG: ribose 5-phosphate isomerase B [Tenericutes bacterium GWE2_34_108]OHE35426.1 MAG: ribose 5-phosphate isomerase B [Tenericutes bacterium GWF1_35_14]OHE38428.1 MAG: ribose 5-phosphate isomerase B [Tenericutes bacterium GWF2_35_184]OHE43068.1 MAG: ribose 5-phosphate isomerase B [Tenericutes bacterium RIFOXYA2_FULL_36_32]OHE46910.